MINFNEFQKIVKENSDVSDKSWTYPLLQLCAKTGEMADKIKGIVAKDTITKFKQREVVVALADVLQYVSQLATELETPLEEIAQTKIKEMIDKNQPREKKSIIT